MYKYFMLAVFGLFIGTNSYAANPLVEIKTSAGAFTVELYPEKSPKTVENFLAYVKSGFYKDTVFHRVIKGFMIQGGGMTTDLQPKPTQPPIPNEAANGLKNLRGTLAMARTNDVDSATAQFFVNLESNAFLDHVKGRPDLYGYSVFGKVLKGMDVVEKIGETRTGTVGPHADVPLQPIVIETMTLLPNTKTTPQKRKKNG